MKRLAETSANCEYPSRSSPTCPTLRLKPDHFKGAGQDDELWYQFHRVDRRKGVSISSAVLKMHGSTGGPVFVNRR